MRRVVCAYLSVLSAWLFASGATAELEFSEVAQLLDKAVAEGKVAGGSVLVLHRGKEVWSRGFGYADLEAKIPFKVDTPAVVASISKPLLGTVAFRFAERGELKRSAPISEVLPEFAKSQLESGKILERAPTLTELFTHTSGLRNDEAKGGRPWFATWTKGKPLEDVVKHYATEFPFKAEPGTRYAYSGIGTDVAARALEVVADKPRNVLLVDELSEPLGMKHTLFRDRRSLEQLPKMPTRYYLKDGRLALSRIRTVPPTNTYSSSGGSIISTAPDLARWLLMIRNRGKHEGKSYLAAKSIAELLAPHPRSKNAAGGLFIRKKSDDGKAVVFGHTGSSGTNCWIDIELDLIGIMLTQTRGKDIKPFRIELERRVTEVVAQSLSKEK